MNPLLFALTLLACSEDPPPGPPIANLLGATLNLEYHGWDYSRVPTGEHDPASDSGRGCLTARKGDQEGTVCSLNCDGRTIREIRKEHGDDFGYWVGRLPEEGVECYSYMTFSGSPELRRILAGDETPEPWNEDEGSENGAGQQDAGEGNPPADEPRQEPTDAPAPEEPTDPAPEAPGEP
ncbi:MAG: hypothetical protein QGG40_04790 [Myxococcota bacterium]|jgi:hypothetical protein|nr:hypothetical protein [Myxococcota bacterium]